MIDKIVPHDVAAEEGVIGSLLLSGDIKSLTLTPADFFVDATAALYAGCIELDKRGVSINPITLANELHRNGKLESSGGASYLSHLIAICPTSLDMPYYAEIVKRTSIARELIKTGDRIQAIGYRDGSTAESLQEADDLILSLRKQSAKSTLITPMDRAAMMAERYEKLNQASSGIALKTGLIDLDRWLGGGLYQGDLIILGARPGMGKTTFLQSISNHVARNHKVLFVSAEMDTAGLTDRDVAGLTKIPIDKIRLGGYDGSTYDAIVNALGEISERQVYHIDHTPHTTARIEQEALGMQVRTGLDFIVVDYLGMLDDKQGENQNIRLGHISRRLKYIARSMNIPVLVAHQLSRASEMRADEDRRPRLSDLRESGHIEEDADVVLLLYRESYYGKPDPTTEVIIAKQRQGQANKAVKVRFDIQSQCYQNLFNGVAND